MASAPRRLSSPGQGRAVYFTDPFSVTGGAELKGPLSGQALANCRKGTVDQNLQERELRAVRRGYWLVAAEYAKRSYENSPGQSYEHAILDLFRAHVQGLVCDLGCGAGQAAHYLRAQGVQVLGVDLSPEMLVEARRRNPDIEFLQAHMGRLPVPDEVWGGIVALFSLIHIPRGEVLDVLRELSRVLRPGGLLLVSFHVGHGTHHSKSWWGIIPVDLEYTRFGLAEMQDYLKDAGFTLETAIESPPRDSTVCPKAYVFARKPVE